MSVCEGFSADVTLSSLSNIYIYVFIRLQYIKCGRTIDRWALFMAMMAGGVWALYRPKSECVRNRPEDLGAISKAKTMAVEHKYTRKHTRLCGYHIYTKPIYIYRHRSWSVDAISSGGGNERAKRRRVDHIQKLLCVCVWLSCCAGWFASGEYGLDQSTR